MKAYIINLERSPERKIYMQEMLRALPCLTPEFISAVDGKTLDEEMRERLFDTRKFQQRYSTYPRLGEIGCTLSHQRCYRKIVEDKEPYVLILEDDIALPDNAICGILQDLEKQIKQEVPQVILLSGWYWYYNVLPLTANYKLANVYDAFLTHAYVINQAAAKLLIEELPYITADDWRYIRKKGVKLQALLPHLIDQNWDGSLPTTVNVETVGCKKWSWKLFHLKHLLFMRLLSIIGHFEKA